MACSHCGAYDGDDEDGDDTETEDEESEIDDQRRPETSLVHPHPCRQRPQESQTAPPPAATAARLRAASCRLEGWAARCPMPLRLLLSRKTSTRCRKRPVAGAPLPRGGRLR